MNELKNDRLLRALMRAPVDSTPVWIMRQAGALSAGVPRDARASCSKSSLIDLLNQQTKLLDHYRILLADATCLFAGIINSSYSTAPSQEVQSKNPVFSCSHENDCGIPGIQP